MKRPLKLAELLGKDTPSNWGKWGAEDELGALNVLGRAEALKGVSSVVTGEVYTLQMQMGTKRSPGDMMWLDRKGVERTNVLDQSTWESGSGTNTGGTSDIRWADDIATLYLQGSTHYDAIGHVWYEDKLYNGIDAHETIGEMKRASIMPIAEKGVVARGVLIDMARHRGKPWLDREETITLDELLAAARDQGSEIEPRDIILIRTGWPAYWFHVDNPEKFYEDYSEPGLSYSRELVEWFQENEIPNLVSDTLGNEASIHKECGIDSLLHAALIRNLGIAFTEQAWLEDLADACARDNRWTFLYSAAPLKIVGAAGGPVNPMAIR